MRNLAWVSGASLSVLLSVDPALAQRCELRQPAGVTVSGRGAHLARIAYSSQGLVVAWRQPGRSTDELVYRAIDPRTMRPTQRAQRLPLDSRGAVLSLPRLTVLSDGSIAATGCACTPTALRCVSAIGAGSSAAPTWSPPAPSAGALCVFDVAASGSSLLATAAIGANRSLQFFGPSVTQPAALSNEQRGDPTLIGLDGDSFALVYRSPMPGAIIAVDSHGGARTPVPFGADASFASAPVRYGNGVLSILFQQSSSAQPPTHTILTWTASGGVARAPLQLPTQRITSTMWVRTMVMATAPSTAGCFLVAWSQSDHREHFIGRVCNNTLDPGSVATIRRPNGLINFAMAGDGQRAFAMWGDDTRDSNNTVVQVSELGCH